MGVRRRARASVPGRRVRRRERRLRRSQRRGSRARAARAASRPPSRRSRRDPGNNAPARPARAFLPPVVRRHRSVTREALAGRLRLHVPSGERAAVPGPGGARAADARRRLWRRAVPATCWRHRRAAHGSRCVSAPAALQDAPGLEAYLAELEDRLEHAVASHRGVVAHVAGEALAAGGKRLRPLLVYLSAPHGAPPVEAGVAVELVHMATLMHDDLIDGARVRRGRASAWSAYGPAAARAAGDFLFARAFAEISGTREARSVAILAEATLCLARGEAMQRSQRHDPDTSVDAYLERCALKTGKLFEAACRLGGGSGAFGLALGIAFQITDDILDCAGVTFVTSSSR